MDRDLDEVDRIRNRFKSTKSSFRIPPFTKEQTRKWYEALTLRDGKYCLACFKDDKIFGYLQFRASPLPFANLKFEEIIVDVNLEPENAANSLVIAVKEFRERYNYRKIFAYMPQQAQPL